LFGVVRVPASTGRDRLAPDYPSAAAVHRENHKRRHRSVPTGRAQTSVAVPSVSHVRVRQSMNKHDEQIIIIYNITVIKTCKYFKSPAPRFELWTETDVSPSYRLYIIMRLFEFSEFFLDF